MTNRTLPAPARHVLFLNRRDGGHPEAGGSEVFLHRVAEQLVALGWRVTVACESYPGAERSEWANGVHTQRLSAGLRLYSDTLWRLHRGHFGTLDVIVDVQNGMPFCSPLVTNVPVINLVHHVHREVWPVVMSAPFARLGWLAESRVGPWVYRRHPYVAVSEATRAELIGLGVDGERIAVVNNGTDPAILSSTPRSARPTVLSVARLVPHKRLDFAIRAVAQLREEIPDIRLVLTGTGYDEENLRALVAELGLNDHVEFPGWVSEEDKHRLMAQAWVMAMPSLKEGWGLSVIEAAAHGTPAVAFQGAGGLAESIVNGQTGLLVEVSQEAFTAALAHLLRNEHDRLVMGDAARVHASTFTWESTAKAMHSMLENAIADQPGS